MWGLSRAVLDQALLDAARDAGAHLLQPARCERLVAGSPPAAVVRDLLTNRVRELRPELVMLADGKAALLPRRPKPTVDMGVKAHFTGVDGPGDAIELFGLRGHYVGLAAIEAHRSNLAMSVPAKRVAHCRGDLDMLFQRIMGENVMLRRRMSSARRVGPWLCSPLPRFTVLRQWAAGIVPIGNAAAAIEPIGGEGIGLAMRSGELAAEAVLLGRTRAQLRDELDRLWRVRSWSCRAAAVALSQSVVSRIVRSAAVPPLTNAALRCIGK
jgi:menaquinone-9 beta-reductase